MNRIDSYEKFCKAFNGGPEEIKRAELLLFVQDWIVRILDKIDEESADYSLDALVIENADKSHLRNAKKDAVSRLVDDSCDAVRRIFENMRENIIRENVKMPVYKVREVNSYGLNWLSRRPGATIKEKISSANASMMAVRRRMSLDTGENRLYMAYLKEMADFLQTKLDEFPRSQLRQEEEHFYSLIFSVIRNSDLDEIRRWENLPPNNTLLSDQNYKKIWRCWNGLKQIDDLIADNNNKISHRISTMFYVEFLTKACRYFWFPQVPVTVNYKEYSVALFSRIFFGIDAAGKALKLEHTDDSIHMEYAGKTIDLNFADIVLRLIINGEKDREIPLNTGTIYKYVELVLAKLGCKTAASAIERGLPALEKFGSVVMDLFAVRPEYIGDDNGVSLLKGRLLQQTHVALKEGERLKFDVACDKANAIIIDEELETYAVSTAVDHASSAQMSKLMHMLEHYVTAQKFIFLFPDIYSEFQLSLVHKAARLVFPEVRSFPRSIGIAFSYIDTRTFEKTFKNNDFLLVVDLVDDDVCFTLLQGLIDDHVEIAIPEYGGFIWERHPSISYSVREEISEITDRLVKLGCIDPGIVYNLFGINGFESENKQLAAIFNDSEAFVFSDAAYCIIKSAKINISEKLNDFLLNHKEIIGNSKVHVVSLVQQLMYKGTCSFEYFKQVKALEGYNVYEKLLGRTGVTLWRDHLPELAIKLLYGKFNLVNNETITPEFNVEKKIPIANVFTLAKDMVEYHFDLVQNDVNRKTRYAAVVKNPAFPIDHDVQCRLDMTYQYGAEEPYRLLFIPVDQEAGFIEAKVSWERITEYPFKDLPYPLPLPCASWDDLRHFAGKYGEEDLIFGKSNFIDTFYQIQSGYQCFDLTGFKPKMEGKPGSRIFTAEFDTNDGCITVIFNERIQEKQNENERRVNFDRLELISCELEEVDLNSTRRYSMDLSVGARSGEVWRRNEYGSSCFRTMTIDGILWKVAFYADSFVNPDSFSPDIINISFEVEKYKENMMRAVRIVDANDDRTYYRANHIRVGNRPGRNVYGSRVFFLLHTIFTGRSSIYDGMCPEALQAVFESARDAWVEIYRQCEDEFIKSRIFGQMSLVANDMGDVYYEIAEERIDQYLDDNSDFMIEYVGYGLGALDHENQKELFKKVIDLPKELIIPILSKAVWANEQFIKNVELPKILSYFNVAIDYLCDIIYKKKRKKTGRKVTACLELILGIFRLREYKDDDLCKAISLNNNRVQKLYSCVEDIIKQTQENCLEVQSFLKLEITDRDELCKDIPDILYAMLVYITGEKGASDIKISGLVLDDVDI